jgi:hypothetical protein
MAALGVAYLLALGLLSELLGSSGDSVATFTTHFNNDASRFGDIAGSLALVVAALLLTATGLSLRHRLNLSRPGLKTDLTAALAVLGASGLLASAGLLISAPLMQTIGDVFSDPGMEPGASAAIAQAGTAMFLCTLLVLGAWTALVVHAFRRPGRTGTWFAVTGWAVAALTLLGVTVGAAAPLGIWWIAFAFRRLP